MAVSAGRLAICAKWIVGSDATAGIGLNRTGEHGGNVATLRGLNFFINNEGNEGSALYPDQGAVGSWRVSSVVDE
jgi:hypothetical protein